MPLSGAGKKRKVGQVLKKVNAFLKKNKLISKGAKIAVAVAPKKYKGRIKIAGETAGLLGYGSCGGGLGLPGGRRGRGLKLAGAGKRKRKRRVGRPCKK